MSGYVCIQFGYSSERLFDGNLPLIGGEPEWLHACRQLREEK